MIGVFFFNNLKESIRILAAKKKYDPIFYVLLLICFAVYCIEVILKSLSIDSYKFSLYFWLEILAAVSLIPDVPWVIEPIQQLLGFYPSSYDADFRVGISSVKRNYITYLYNILNSFKFFKLLQIVQLYTYFADSRNNEEKNSTGQPNADNAQQAAMKKEMDPDKLGKTLSDINTRIILIEVILMYVAYPLLTPTITQNPFERNLDAIFYAGTGKCNFSVHFNMACLMNFTKAEGWNMLMRWYVDLGKVNDKYYYEVISIHVPDYDHQGQIVNIKEVPDPYSPGIIHWREMTECADRIVSDQEECTLRPNEMKIVKYTPEPCADGTLTDCTMLIIYVRLNIRKEIVKNALYRLIIIIFTTILLFFSAILVRGDTMEIVVIPIKRVIKVIRKLTDDPLLMPTREKDDEDYSTRTSVNFEVLKTNALENNLYRIGKYLTMGYGKLGTTIIRNNMLTGEGEVNIMVPGIKIQAIYLICKIDRFGDIANGLQESTTVFLNKFAKIIHDCAVFWGGNVNKNTGETFYITWKLQNIEDHSSETKKQSGNEDKSKLAVKALVAAIKIFAEVKRATDLKAYARHAKLRK